MKLSQLNEWLTLVANLGVIAGIFFVAVQIQQNTDMMQAQTRDSVTAKQIEFYIGVTDNEYVADVYTRGRTGEYIGKGPDDRDSNTFTLLAITNFRVWENEWYQYRKGLFGEPEFLARSSNWASLVQRFPGFQDIWDDAKTTFEPSFGAYLDGKIAELETN